MNCVMVFQIDFFVTPHVSQRSSTSHTLEDVSEVRVVVLGRGSGTGQLNYVGSSSR
jgi:hypothetical protein